jgi:hypothetical protein
MQGFGEHFKFFILAEAVYPNFPAVPVSYVTRHPFCLCVAQHRPTQFPTPISLIGHSSVTYRTGRAALVMVNDELSFPLCKSFFLIT